MNDSELDKLLQSALDVEPSPHLAARVRASVVRDRSRSPWMMAAAAAAVVLCLVAWNALVHRPGGQEGVAPGVVRLGETAAVTSARAPARSEVAPPETDVSATARAARPRESRRPSLFASVLIAPEDQRGFQAFVATAHAGVLPPTLTELRLGSEAPVRIPSIEPLAPINIEPLPPITRLEFTELN